MPAFTFLRAIPWLIADASPLRGVDIVERWLDPVVNNVVFALVTVAQAWAWRWHVLHEGDRE